MTWAATRRAFAVTSRALEYGAADAVGTDKGNGARSVDTTFKKGVEVSRSETPDELVRRICGDSKTDQYNRGELLNLFLSGDADRRV
eukprot:2017731-Heterocapsa_arctica.AAC.1